MKRPKQNPKVDFIAKAREAWGDAIPDWVEALAAEATRTRMNTVADKIGYSSAAVSYVLANKYTGDLSRVETKVRGALMKATVMCPVLGEIGTHVCADEQKKPFTGASSIRSKLYRACRNGCPNSRIEPKGDAA